MLNCQVMRVIVLARSHILVAVLNAFYLTLSAPKVAGDVAPQMTDAVLPIGTMNCRVMQLVVSARSQNPHSIRVEFLNAFL